MRRVWVLAFILVAAAGGAAVYLIFQALQPSPTVLKGSMFVSDAGRSHGGFEYNAEWNATLTVKGSTGVLELILNIGLGDDLQKHEYSVTEFTRDQSRINMKVDEKQVVLVWVEEDEIWDRTYNKHYIASWGGDAPPEEIRGTVSPTIFPGLTSHYYVELRLR